MLLLITGKGFNGNAVCCVVFATESDVGFLGSFGSQGFLSLLPIEHFEQIVGCYCLVPEHIVWMSRFFVVTTGRMAINNWTAKGHVVCGITVASYRAMSTRKNEFVVFPFGHRIPEDGDTLFFTEPTHIVLELLVESFHPVGIYQPFPRLSDKNLLFLRVEIACESVICDTPIVGDMGSEQPVFLIPVVPRKAKYLFLTVA